MEDPSVFDRLLWASDRLCGAEFDTLSSCSSWATAADYDEAPHVSVDEAPRVSACDEEPDSCGAECDTLSPFSSWASCYDEAPHVAVDEAPRVSACIRCGRADCDTLSPCYSPASFYDEAPHVSGDEAPHVSGEMFCDTRERGYGVPRELERFLTRLQAEEEAFEEDKKRAEENPSEPPTVCPDGGILFNGQYLVPGTPDLTDDSAPDLTDDSDEEHQGSNVAGRTRCNNAMVEERRPEEPITPKEFRRQWAKEETMGKGGASALVALRTHRLN